MAQDRRQWHEGSRGQVMVVIMVKLFPPNSEDRVRVILQISHTTPTSGVDITRRVRFLISVSCPDRLFTEIP